MWLQKLHNNNYNYENNDKIYNLQIMEIEFLNDDQIMI